MSSVVIVETLICCRCRELGKQRTITVIDDVITGRKHPEDDHHQDCQPIAENIVTAQQFDREMRKEIRSTGQFRLDAMYSLFLPVCKLT